MAADPSLRRPAARVLPPSPRVAALTMLVFTAVLYVAETIDVISQGYLDQEAALVPRSGDGLLGILTAPLLHTGLNPVPGGGNHVGWAHLFANTLPFLIFGFLAMSGGIRQWVAVTAVVWLVSGIGVWLFSPGPTLGASGVIFGWFVFLLVRGFFVKGWGQIALAAVLFLLWGGLLWGVLPTDPLVSWQAHLFGALGGLLAGYLVGRADRPSRARPGAPAPQAPQL